MKIKDDNGNVVIEEVQVLAGKSGIRGLEREKIKIKYHKADFLLIRHEENDKNTPPKWLS